MGSGKPALNPKSKLPFSSAEVIRAAREASLDFRSRGACIGTDPDEFYCDRNSVDPKIKEMCGGCPVQLQCLAWGIRHEKLGIWGGESQRSRERARRRLHIPYNQLEPVAL